MSACSHLSTLPTLLVNSPEAFVVRREVADDVGRVLDGGRSGSTVT
jgi:hypothetical protein